MWYLVLSRSPADRTELEAHYEPHRAWLDAQHRAGRMLFSGPTQDQQYGIYVLLAPSLEEARALAAEDPHHSGGYRTIEAVLPWDVRRSLNLAGPTIKDLEAMAQGGSPSA